MRFEGKHSYFKDLAHRVKCFKNIAKTMAERHQELLCYYLNTENDVSPFVKNTMVGAGKHADAYTCTLVVTCVCVNSPIIYM